MPSVSVAQKKTACIALAMKRGDLKMTPNTPAGKMAESMTEKELTDMCGSRIKK